MSNEDKLRTRRAAGELVGEPVTEPHFTRFDVHQVTGRIVYTIEGYGQVMRGAAVPGTTQLFLLLQFMAQHAPHTVTHLPASVSVSVLASELESLLQTLTERGWAHDLAGFGQNINGNTYVANITRSTVRGGKGVHFSAQGETPYEALSRAYKQAVPFSPGRNDDSR